MNKLFLTMALAFFTTIASAQYQALTTIKFIEAEETSYNATDKIGVGYNLNECAMIGVTMDGEDAYEFLARYTVHESGVWVTAVYNYDEGTKELIDRMDLGLGYSFKLWKDLYFDPNFTMPLEEDKNGEREGAFNLSVSYRF